MKQGLSHFNKEVYRQRAVKTAPRSPLLRDSLCAFAIGGTVALLGEWLGALYTVLGAETEARGIYVSVTLIFLSVVLTAAGIYDRIARVGGAGTLVPITGFANAIVSPAIDNKSEGQILGVGAKIFTVAGPVLLFGTLAGAVYGVLYWLVTAILPLA